MSVLASAHQQEIPAFQADDDTCPQCKSERYLNKPMKLLVGPCYHKMCESCVTQRFDAGPAPCPVCERILRKAEFYQQIFEDLTVENEVRIRKRMAMIFNKRQEDFKQLKDYNDYLEMVEDITLKLLYDEDTDEAEFLIEKYRRDNTALIVKNQTKLRREEVIQRLIFDQEQLKRQQQWEEQKKQYAKEEREKAEIKNSLITALATSTMDAKDIVKAKMIQLKKSSLSSRNAMRSVQFNYDDLLADVDDGNDLDEGEAESAPLDPAESPYEPVNIELMDRYDDPFSAFRQGGLTAAGVTREMHQRYLIEGALAGLFARPLDDDDSVAEQQ
ncbi:TFIIH/NER complex subunit [Coemansia thaxteri]|uniref:RNA polymerase II transcription factor B subunit 3 n=1 Tax=Coemansia thaxteri TaxID=2663907 RepID=A0A9W8EKR2_9FUNG|nr:TFIIH/NER complex subunit [Coemansia thaxteri]KAJ2008871.1 TFIIH/NER complex subunit [Coemansia thaxteri]KAJ2473442.1 TFIIH/NER complex subunit [Coemansia sp. RSA 2322]KAJ2483582.1 TFIIH/NER complex subunit [Coemansia sp. RSA 2320]